MHPPPDLRFIFPFLRKYQDHMFIFTDQMACLIYDNEWRMVVYLVGAFDSQLGEGYNTHVMQYAKEASMN